ncbi:double-strand break repair helicase AddA [Thalassobaculum fulvum]|uniref:DNA 3'-5' helicase n=1 Tax=Thalassobaculum fulvum TaxID=1633335 RepID=A0A918XMZ3_9PROT|nr:double-strand break repair helicase AddA [Thalassobaculum fulvum]GHD40588.1 double-strand break repair helicase AddA [Thalassobaculum fulvum]
MTDATVIALASERQRAAADPAASAWVAASAGSGKTKVLTDRLLNLLLDGASPERLLCLTYTKAAAAEMATRLQGRLAEWTVVPEPELVDDLAALSGTTPSRRRLAKARRLFAEVLDAPGGLKIQTIHAFAQSLLGRFPLEAGVPPHFRLADDRASAGLLADAEAHVLARARTAEESKLADALGVITGKANQDQFRELMRAVLAARTRLRAALGAAGGPDGLAAAIHRRLGIAPGTGDRELLLAACASRAFDAPALRRAAEALTHGAKTDVRRAPVIADWLSLQDAEQRANRWDEYRDQFLKQDGTPLARQATKGTLDFDAAAADTLLAEAERLVAVEEMRKACATAERTVALLTLATAVIEAYEAAKARRAELDYEDLVERARSLLQRPGVAAWVLFKLDGGLDHILIDEAQDTSPAQWDIVRALAEEFFAGSGAHESRHSGGRHPPVERTIFAVGDVKQSIYSFQGADPAGFGAARSHFATRVADAGKLFRRVPLEQSFRSTDAVLQAVDAVFALPEAQDGVAEIEADGGSVPIVHNAVRTGHAGRVEIWPLVDPVEPEGSAPWAPPVERRSADEPRARLAQGIADRIRGWLDDRTPLPSKGRPVGAGDVMVLVQRRGPFVHELVAALKRARVPVAGVDRLVLTDQMAVRDLVALGRAVLLPEDDLTLAGVLKGPLVGLTEDQLYDLCQGREQPRVWRELRRRSAEGGVFLEADRRFGEWLGLADRVPPHDFFQRILARGGRERLVRRLGHEAEDAIDEFMAQALAYERESTPSLQGFLHWLAAGDFEVKRELEGAGGSVRVMTVHGAKGLQAPIVILPDTLRVPQLQDRWLWHADAGGAEIPLWTTSAEEADRVSAAARAEARRRQDQEYRRLLYVAMTRAEDRLVVCGWNGRRKATAGNWYELIRRGLEPIAVPVPDPVDPEAAPTLVIETAQAADVRPPAADTVAAVPPPPDWAFRPPSVPEPSPPRPLAPSRPAGEEPPVRSPLDADDGRRFKRGLILHRLLQTLPDLAPGQRAEAGRRFLARPMHGLEPETAEAWLAEALAVLDDPAFAAAFAPGSRAEVPVVGVVPGPDGPEVVSGRIDRLVITGDAVLVVDFKTNRPAPASVDAVPEAYRRQMRTYRTLLADLYPDRRIRCALVWTDGPRLMELP